MDHQALFRCNSLTEDGKGLIVKKYINEKLAGEEIIKFQLISREKLVQIRKKKDIPSFVLKTVENDEIKYYWCKVPAGLSFAGSNFLGYHKCTSLNMICNRFSAATDENGGCAKVRQLSTRIERYPWILCGYETFGVHRPAFVVLQCEHYEKMEFNTRSSVPAVEFPKNNFKSYSLA